MNKIIRSTRIGKVALLATTGALIALPTLGTTQAEAAPGNNGQYYKKDGNRGRTDNDWNRGRDNNRGRDDNRGRDRDRDNDRGRDRDRHDNRNNDNAIDLYGTVQGQRGETISVRSNNGNTYSVRLYNKSDYRRGERLRVVGRLIGNNTVQATNITRL